jgi:hypothetical protein
VLVLTFLSTFDPCSGPGIVDHSLHELDCGSFSELVQKARHSGNHDGRQNRDFFVHHDGHHDDKLLKGKISGGRQNRGDLPQARDWPISQATFNLLNRQYAGTSCMSYDSCGRKQETQGIAKSFSAPTVIQSARLCSFSASINSAASRPA